MDEKPCPCADETLPIKGRERRPCPCLPSLDCWPTSLLAASSLGVASIATPVRLRTDQLELGQGFNSATGEAGGLVIDASGSLVTTANAFGQDISYKVDHLINTLDTFQSLNVSAAASFSFGIFGADAAVQFLNTARRSTYTSYLVIEANVRNPAEMMGRYSLSGPGIQTLLRDPDNFWRFCGDTFVSGRVTGGAVQAIVELSSDTYSNFTAVNAELSAHYGPFASGSVSVASLDTATGLAHRRRILITAKGGLTVIPTVDHLEEALRNFPVLVSSGSPLTSVLGVPFV